MDKVQPPDSLAPEPPVPVDAATIAVVWVLGGLRARVIFTRPIRTLRRPGESYHFSFGLELLLKNDTTNGMFIASPL